MSPLVNVGSDIVASDFLKIILKISHILRDWNFLLQRNYVCENMHCFCVVLN